MARLEDKIAEIADPRLREAIAEEVRELKKNKQFGLVFEAHQPEVVPVPQAAVRKDAIVAKRGGNLGETWQVTRIHDGMAEIKKEADDSRETVPVDALVVVRRMGQPIYPALVPIDCVRNTDPSQPHHILIEAENYHALQLLGYLYAGKVDCIYIDPPYNTGARDWKYNNNYVDGNDAWRHSKWLSMMQKRLELAKRLLKPDGVLIVTIDDNEVSHLSLLLRDIFPAYLKHQITIVINPGGTYQINFARVHEYAFYVCPPHVETIVGKSIPSMDREYDIWKLRRTGAESAHRYQRPKQFYPIFVCKDTLEVTRVGPEISADSKYSIAQEGNEIPIYPIDRNGTERVWRYGRDTMAEKITEGTIFAKNVRGTINLYMRALRKDSQRLKTVWYQGQHSSVGTGSTVLVDLILGQTNAFPFPKSIYSVKDALSAVCRTRKTAVIVDFFAGSGTTLNAVNLLNAADGGRRQCILVTNNEVSAEETEALRARSLQPGDDQWGALGICRSVTWPRNKFTILGRRDDGTPLPGEYLTGRTVARDKPRAIRQLGFAEGRNLTLPQRKQLAAIMPSVPQTKIDDGPWFLDDEIPIAILWDAQKAEEWLEALAETDLVTDFYVVTTETRLFNGIKAQIQEILGPISIHEEEKRPLAAGFAANLAYFKLDFLEPGEVAMGHQFAAILPILWMMAGAKGPLPEAPDPHAPWLIPTDGPFAVLLRESRFREFLAKIASRANLAHVFLVTNSESAFHDMRDALPEGLVAVQLYKNYLDNFKINAPRA